MWKSRLNKLCDGALSSSSNADFTRHSTDGEENTCIGQISNCQLNTSLSEFLPEFIRVWHKSSTTVSSLSVLFQVCKVYLLSFSLMYQNF